MFRQGLFYSPPANVHPLVFLVVAAWSLLWKGISLWKSARNSQRYWFIALLLINTLGILEIIYLKFFQNIKITKKK